MCDVLGFDSRSSLRERGAPNPNEQPSSMLGVELVPGLRSRGEQVPRDGIHERRRRGVVSLVGAIEAPRDGRSELRKDRVASGHAGSREGRADQPGPQPCHGWLVGEELRDIRLVDLSIRNGGRNRQHAYGHTPW